MSTAAATLQPKPPTHPASMTGAATEHDVPAVLAIGVPPAGLEHAEDAVVVPDAFQAVLRLSDLRIGTSKPLLLVSLAILTARQHAVVRAAKRSQARR